MKQQLERDVGGAVLDLSFGLIDAAKRGGAAWEEMADRIIASLLRIAIEKSKLTEQLGALLMQGLGAFAQVFGGTTPGASYDITGLTTDSQFQQLGAGLFIGQKASGGPVEPHHAYVVGEQGPELLVTGPTSGYVYPAQAMPAPHRGHGSAAPAPITVVFHINTPDAQSFQRSRAEIQRGIVQVVQNSLRNA
jgi:hypothetical protein